MRNAFKFLVAGALFAGTVGAQQQSESVDSILQELSRQTAGGSPSVAEVSVAGTDVAVDVPVADVDTTDLPATLDASRGLYVSGEFERAQQGFEAVIKKDPENAVARAYLRKIMERDPRIAEVQGMKDLRQEWTSGLVLRSYDISAKSAEKIGLESLTESTDVTMKFPEVAFPKGASAVYQPKTGKLFIRNTPENLLVAEDILGAMDVALQSSEVEQVEVEAKFVEVAEGTLEQLGFEWRMAGEDMNLGDGVSLPTASGNQYLFDDALRGGPGNVNPALPFGRPGSLDARHSVSSAGNGDWTAFRFEDTFDTTPSSLQVSRNKNVPFDTWISALDQTSGTDVLSAPRIVTRSGEKAIIRVGEVHYYPEVYEVGANEGNIVHITYQDFAEKLLGVELDVTPQVDGDQIRMKLNPKVTELAGWQNYSVVSGNNSYAYYQYRVSILFKHDPIFAQLPVFDRREIDTEVTINDGATMGMGGLMNERVEKYEDKVPVLGSLPLVGRLFRNEGERAVKRNLMIFVTAKKVEATGRINTARSFE